MAVSMGRKKSRGFFRRSAMAATALASIGVTSSIALAGTIGTTYNLVWSNEVNSAQTLTGSMVVTNSGAVSFNVSNGFQSNLSKNEADAGISAFSVTAGGQTYSLANGKIVGIYRDNSSTLPSGDGNIVSDFQDLNFFTIGSNGGPIGVAVKTVLYPSNGPSPGLVSAADQFDLTSVIAQPSSHPIASGTNFFSDLGGTLNPVFDGGTLTTSGNGSTSDGFTLNAAGGTIDTAGHVLIFSGRFTDASGVTKSGLLVLNTTSGSGEVVLQNPNNTFDGGIQVDPGTTLSIKYGGSLGSGVLVLIGNGTTPSIFRITDSTTIDNSITLSGDPVFDVADGKTATIASPITDGASPGDLVKQGLGTLILQAGNTYTGPTTVAAGSLQVDGSIVSPTTVDPGGTLRGTGTVAGVDNNGMVMPGDPSAPGILIAHGDYVQGPGGSLAIRITPTTSDRLDVTGSAALNGTLAIDVGSGTYRIGQNYDILQANGGVTGHFAAVDYSAGFAPYIDPTITYGGDQVDLALRPLPAAFDTGRAYVASGFVRTQSLMDLSSSILSAGSTRGAWLHALGGFGSANGYDENYKGAVAGRGFRIRPDVTAGFAVSVIGTTTDIGDTTLDGLTEGVAGYIDYRRNGLRIAADIGGGHIGDTMRRGLPTLNTSGTGRSSGYYDFADVMASYHIRRGRFFIVPDVEATYLHTDIGSMHETGAGILNLSYEAMRSDIGRIGADLTAGTNVRRRFGTVTPWVRLGGYATVGNPRVSDTETLGVVDSIQYASLAPAAAMTFGGGVDLVGHDHWRGDIGWTGSFGGGTRSQEFTAGVRYVW